MGTCFVALIDVLDAHSGDVLFFGGDALFVVFRSAGHQARAVAAGRALQATVRGLGPITTPLGTIRVGMTMGIATGTADLVIGDGPQRPWFVTGEVIDRALRLEAAAESGQLLVDDATANGAIADGAAHRDLRQLGEDRWRVSTTRLGAAHLDPKSLSVALAGRGDLPAGLVCSERPELHLPARLRGPLQAGEAHLDHRHASVAFAKVRGGADILSKAATLIGTAAEDYGVTWNETDCTQGGGMIVLASGVPVRGNDDELRLAAVARRIVDSDLAPHVSVGLHRGTVFIGAVGAASRAAFAVTGLTTVTAARLSGRAEPGTALASDDLVAHLRGQYATGASQDLRVKGRRAAVTVRALGSRTVTTRQPSEVDIVGRTTELAHLRQMIDRYAGGGGSVTELVGPPGMGKSALLDWVRATVDDRLEVIGDVEHRVVPFGALGPFLQQALSETLSSPDAGDVLFPILGPVIGVPLEATRESLAVEENSVLAVRTTLLVNLLSTRPAVLLVEDGHWLDPSSAVLLNRLLDRLAEAGWLVVISRRDDAPALSEHASVLVLEPLSDADVATLAMAVDPERALSDAALRSIVSGAHGNPLYAQQLAASASVLGDSALAESAERVIGSRIDRLSLTDRRDLRRASALGNPVDLDLLAEVAGIERDWTELRDFVDVRGGTLRFVQDLFRLAAYEGLRYTERQQLHRSAATTLEQRGDAPVAVLAEHWRRAADPDQTLLWAGKAAETAAEQAAWDDEARWRAIAVDAARAGHVAADERARLLDVLGGCYERIGEPDRATTSLEAAAALLPAEARTPIKIQLAWLSFRQDQLDRARRQVAAALSRTVDPGNRAELLVLRSAIRADVGDRKRSDDDARTAIELATQSGRSDAHAAAAMQLALNADDADDDGARALIDVAIPLLYGAGRIRDIALLQLNHGISQMIRGAWVEALAAFDAAMGGFLQCGYLIGLIATDINRGGLVLEQGDPAASLQMYATAVRRAKATGQHRLARFASGSAFRARGWQGEVDQAIDGLTEDIAWLNERGHVAEALDLDCYLLEVLVLAGRFGEARAMAVDLEPRLADREGEVVVLTVRRLAAMAAHFEGAPEALTQLAEVLGDARRSGASIEIARCLAAQQELGVAEPDATAEIARHCEELGVTWLPPSTFAIA